jgi:hypothetical protein
MNSDLAFFPFLFGMISFVVWTVGNGWQRRQHRRLIADFNSRLLDRIGSGKDFTEFLQSEGGVRFMDTLKVERVAPRAEAGILRATQVGIVLVMLGLGLLALGRYLTYRYSAFDEYEVLTIFGVIALSLGVGFLLSAIASFRVGRMLGVFERTERHTD